MTKSRPAESQGGQIRYNYSYLVPFSPGGTAAIWSWRRKGVPRNALVFSARTICTPNLRHYDMYFAKSKSYRRKHETLQFYELIAGTGTSPDAERCGRFLLVFVSTRAREVCAIFVSCFVFAYRPARAKLPAICFRKCPGIAVNAPGHIFTTLN